MKYLILTESAEIAVSEKQKELVELELSESSGSEVPFGIIVDIEAIHTGPTRNHTWYTEGGIKSGLKSWTTPYPKPILQDHVNSAGSTSMFGGSPALKGVDPKGRIIGSKVDKSTNLLDENGNPVPALHLAAFIPEEEDIKKILNGTYHTVSIGVASNKVNCSICGANITEEYCGHMKGRVYEIDNEVGKKEKKKCYWYINHTEGLECSFVNIPADVNAKVSGVRKSLKPGEKLPVSMQEESANDLFIVSGKNIINASEVENISSSESVMLALSEAWSIPDESKNDEEKTNLAQEDEFITVEDLEKDSLPSVGEEADIESETEDIVDEVASQLAESSSQSCSDEQIEQLLDSMEEASKDDTENLSESDTHDVVDNDEKENDEYVEELKKSIEELNEQLNKSKEDFSELSQELSIIREQNSRLRNALSKMLCSYITDLELFAAEISPSEYDERLADNTLLVGKNPSDALAKIELLKKTEMEAVTSKVENEVLSDQKENTEAKIDPEQILLSALRERKAGIRHRK